MLAERDTILNKITAAGVFTLEWLRLYNIRLLSFRISPRTMWADTWNVRATFRFVRDTMYPLNHAKLREIFLSTI